MAKLVYSFIARNDHVIADYAYVGVSSSLIKTAMRILNKLPSSNNDNLFTCKTDEHTFNYLVERPFTYCVVALQCVELCIPIACIELIKKQFIEKHADNNDVESVKIELKEHMQYCVDHSKELGKRAELRVRISELKNILMENVEQLEGSVENTEVPADEVPADDTEDLHYKWWYECVSTKVKLLVVGIIVFLGLAVILGGCPSFDCGC